jgi:hypothetical protein
MIEEFSQMYYLKTQKLEIFLIFYKKIKIFKLFVKIDIKKKVKISMKL